MIRTRIAMLAVATALVLAASGAASADLQPSARLVMVTAVVGLLAPLFWPGNAATLGLTATRVALWSLGIAVLTLIVISIARGAGLPLPRAASACAVLLLILVLTHAFAAGLEALLQEAAESSDGAREMATWTVFAVLVLLGSAPLWLGPMAELLANGDRAVLDAVIGVSPLTHLAVASDNDLLRNQWFYQHSNLAALQWSYPGLGTIILCYLTAILALAIAPIAVRVARAAAERTHSTHPTSEHSS